MGEGAALAAGKILPSLLPQDPIHRCAFRLREGMQSRAANVRGPRLSVGLAELALVREMDPAC